MKFKFCTFALLFSTFFFAVSCSSEDKNAGGTSEAENAIAITEKTVAGVSQKGPFTSGSFVTLYELNFRTRAQTGKSFVGKITSDKGEFSIDKIELASQYALFRADGFYRNEITGKVSASQISLNAISDLSERENVNVNLLTHLEYERAVWLAMEKEITIKEAKAEADREIFAVFGAEYDGNRFEDLDIFGNGDADAALLGISVIMHAGRSEGEFSQALANLALDLQNDGKWDNLAAIAATADNSFEADTVQIRKNIESWDISKTVPEFAPIVEQFWNDVFGLGRCTAKREGETRPDSNSRSRYYGEDFVCEKGHWHLIGEKKTPSSASNSSSSTSDKTESSSSSTTKLSCSSSATKRSSSSWEYVNAPDSPYDENTSIIDKEILSSLGNCDTENEVKKVLGNSFICKGGLWFSRLLVDMEPGSQFNPNITYGTLTDKRDGQTYKTVVIGTQNWMAENLHYAGENASEELAANLAGEILCPTGDEEFCKKTGYFYSWTAAVNISPEYRERQLTTLPIDEIHQGICPDGWHIPSLDEWYTLVDYIATSLNRETAALKSQESWIYSEKKYIPTNETGFSAIATGCDYLWEQGKCAGFHTSHYNTSQNCSGGNFNYWSDEADFGGRFTSILASVRCVENPK